VLGHLQILTWLEKAPNLHRHLHDSPPKSLSINKLDI
jgi:hypothetical protein